MAIDEIQFFDPSIVPILLDIGKNGIEVYAAGLDLNFRGEEFKTTNELMKRADEVEHLTARCEFPGCNKPATRSQRIIDGKPAPYDSPLVVIGGKEMYQARCEEHHIVPKPKKEA